MDSQFFRVPTQPNFYETVQPSRSALKFVGTKTTAPTPDSRFPGYAATMHDARLVTDYRPHCTQNVKSAQQFATKQWMQTNTDEIIRVSRERHADATGAVYSHATTVPPPSQIVQCGATQCSVVATGSTNGLGTERSYDKAPELFGTYTFPHQMHKKTNTDLNTKFEGGRNSPRGRSFEALGNKPLQ